MTVIPEKFRRSPPLAIASYDFADIDEGAGYVVYNGLVTSASYLLTKQDLYSHVVEDSLNTASASYVTVFEQTFSVQYNLPKIVKGTAYFNIPFYNSGGTGTDKTVKTTITVYHYDGSTQTQLATVNSEDNHTGVVETPSGKKVKCLSVAITQKQFKVGETLQVTVKCEGKNNGGGSTTFYVAHDPANRTGSTQAATSTLMLFAIPYKLDV